MEQLCQKLRNPAGDQLSTAMRSDAMQVSTLVEKQHEDQPVLRSVGVGEGCCKALVERLTWGSPGLSR